MSKVQIDIILRCRFCPFQTSMATRVTELDSTRQLFFDAPRTAIRHKPLTIAEQKNMDKQSGRVEIEDDCCDSVITLYSDKNFDEFARQLAAKYNFVDCGPCNNCSDTADFTLNYFFPEKKKQIDTYYAIYKTFCCWGSILLCNRFFPGPCFMNTPGDVHKKARILFWLNNSANSSQQNYEQIQESKPTYQLMS
jgi:hypothetical protein